MMITYDQPENGARVLAKPNGKTVIHGVLGVMQRGDRLLMIRRSATVRVGGVWCFPGGTVEHHEPQETALVREMHEELGLRVRPVSRFFVLVKHGGGLVLNCWRAEIVGGALRPNPAEVADARWLTGRQLRRMRRTRCAVPHDHENCVITGTWTILGRLGM